MASIRTYQYFSTCRLLFSGSMTHRVTAAFFMALILSTIMANPAVAQPETTAVLKKLFYTQSQREKIDAFRYKPEKNTSSKASKKNSEKAAASEKNTSVIKIDGYVKRADGKNVIWYNNKNTLNSSRLNSTTKFQSGVIVNKGIHIISSRKKMRIEPGQVLNIDSGKIQDQYKLLDTKAKIKVENQ